MALKRKSMSKSAIKDLHSVTISPYKINELREINMQTH